MSARFITIVISREPGGIFTASAGLANYQSTSATSAAMGLAVQSFGVPADRIDLEPIAPRVMRAMLRRTSRERMRLILWIAVPLAIGVAACAAAWSFAFQGGAR